MSDKRLDILIVEDNPGDAYILKELLSDLKLDLNITVAEDGQAALIMLEAQRDGHPSLVILDLNLPKINGFEVLSFMKSSQSLSLIPVVVMTGSLRSEDEQRSRELGAVDYCIKPATVEEMDRSLRCLRAYLEPLCRDKGNERSPDPSVRANLYGFTMDGCDRRLSAPHRDHLIIDSFENGPRTPWR
jgi:CheY-like chemotaxis protein